MNAASPLFPFCVVLKDSHADNCHSSRLALVRSSHYRAACAGSWPSPPVAGNWFPRSAHVESGVDWVGSALQQLRLSQVREQTSTGVSGRLCLRTEEQRMGSNVRRRLLKRRQLRLQSQIFYRHGTRDACGACGVPHWSISRRHAPVSLLVGLHGLLLFGLPHGS